MALGVLIKGLLGVALPAFAIFLFLMFKKELRKAKEFHLLPGLLIILVIGLPWYIAEYMIHGKVFLEFALGFLFLSRFQGAVSGHAGPWYYYFFALILGFAPWSQFLPVGLWQTWKRATTRDSRLVTRDPELLTLCFILPAFIVFSIAKTKIPNYVLPLYPFLAIMVAAMWDRFFNDPAKERKAFVISNICFAVVIVLIFIGVIMLGNSNYPSQYAALMPSLLGLAATLLLGGLFSIMFFFTKAYHYSFAVIPVMVFGIALILTVEALPQVENFKGAKPLGQELAKVVKNRQMIAAYETGNRPSVVLHSPATVTFLTKEAELDRFLSAKKGFAFTTTDEYEKIRLRLPRGAKVFDKKGDLLVIY
jgi:4-amino-4-deoxy-L-arabinose transferase-like glycosyltransferase